MENTLVDGLRKRLGPRKQDEKIRKKTLTVRLPAEEYDDLRVVAAREGTSMERLVRESIREVILRLNQDHALLERAEALERSQQQEQPS